MEDVITGLFIPTNGEAQIVEVKNTLFGIRELLGVEWITVTAIAPDLLAVCDDEGLLKSDPTVTVTFPELNRRLVGNVLITGIDDTGDGWDNGSLTDEQIEWLKRRVVTTEQGRSVLFMVGVRPLEVMSAASLIRAMLFGEPRYSNADEYDPPTDPLNWW